MESLSLLVLSLLLLVSSHVIYALLIISIFRLKEEAERLHFDEEEKIR